MFSAGFFKEALSVCEYINPEKEKIRRKISANLNFMPKLLDNLNGINE
jgi:hypothetical protein